jgi:hypothetical protein
VQKPADGGYRCIADVPRETLSDGSGPNPVVPSQQDLSGQRSHHDRHWTPRTVSSKHHLSLTPCQASPQLTSWRQFGSRAGVAGRRRRGPLTRHWKKYACRRAGECFLPPAPEHPAIRAGFGAAPQGLPAGELVRPAATTSRPRPRLMTLTSGVTGRRATTTTRVATPGNRRGCARRRARRRVGGWGPWRRMAGAQRKPCTHAPATRPRKRWGWLTG